MVGRIFYSAGNAPHPAKSNALGERVRLGRRPGDTLELKSIGVRFLMSESGAKENSKERTRRFLET